MHRRSPPMGHLLDKAFQLINYGLLRNSPFYVDSFVYDRSRDSLDIVFHGQMREFNSFHHVGCDQRGFKGHLVSQGDRPRTVGSSGGHEHLKVNGILKFRQRFF